MPTIFFYGPQLDPEKKREMVKAFTKSASEATGIPESAFVVYLRSVEHEDVSVGGVLLADKMK
jgi:4-oxalocrotonate tautomerase